MASKNQVRLEAVAEVQKARAEILKLVETVNKLTEALGKTVDKKFQITTGESIAKLDALEKELVSVGNAVTKSADAVEKQSAKRSTVGRAASAFARRRCQARAERPKGGRLRRRSMPSSDSMIARTGPRRAVALAMA